MMTLICNHDGVVYEKNLGTETTSAARAMPRFDPDPSWTRFRSSEIATKLPLRGYVRVHRKRALRGGPGVT